MLFNGNLAFLHFLSIFHVIQWEFCISSIFHVIQWEHEAQKLWWGGVDGRTDVWKFTPVSYRTSALWGRCPKRGPTDEPTEGRMDGRTDVWMDIWN